MDMQLVVIGDNDEKFPLQVKDGSPVTADYNFKDIKDLKAKGSHSYSFRLPSTRDNDKYFGHYFMVGSYFDGTNNTFNPFIKREAYITKDSIEVLSGYIQLKNVYFRQGCFYEYECIVFSSEISFTDALKGLKFNQINYAEWNHKLSSAKVLSSFDDVGTGIDNRNLVYSLWDYGQGIATNQYIDFFQGSGGQPAINMQKLRPQARLKALIDKIFDHVGFTFESNFLSTTEFQKIYVDLNWNKRDNLAGIVPPHQYLVQAKSTTTINLTLGNEWHQNLLLVPTELSDASASWNTVTAVGNSVSRWQVQEGGYYDITITGTFTPSSAFTNTIVGVRIYENPDLTNYPYSTNYQTAQIPLNIGSGGLVTATTSVVVQGDEDCYFSFYASDIYDGNTLAIENLQITIVPTSLTDSSDKMVYIPNLIGDLDVETFFKGLITKFNLVVIPDANNSRNVIIETYNDFIESGNELNWTKKVDYSKDIQVIPPTKFCGKRVEFRDAKTDDYISQDMAFNPSNLSDFTYGSYIEPGVQNQFSDKVTEFKSLFSPTINYALEGNGQSLGFYSCARFSVDSDGSMKNIGGMCLSYYHGNHDMPNGTYYKLNFGETNIGGSISEVPFFSEYSEKYFGENDTAYTINWAPGLLTPNSSWDALPTAGLAKRYWSNFLQDNFNVNSRMLVANLRLTPQDISDFNFNDIIVINSEKYIVNSIKGFPISSSGNCKVELLATIQSSQVLTNTSNGTSSVACDYIVGPSVGVSGVLNFTNSAGQSVTITEQCCNDLGYYYYQNECYNTIQTGNQGGINRSIPAFVSHGGTDDLGNAVIGANGRGNPNPESTERMIQGNNNHCVNLKKTKIRGDNNIVETDNFAVLVQGNNNHVYQNVSNSTIDGNDNELYTNNYQLERWGVKLNVSTNLKDVLVNGDNGCVYITGDRILSKLNVQTGEHSVSFTCDVIDRNRNTFLIGQYGVFANNTDFNNIRYNQLINNNAFKFKQKNNLQLVVEFIGVSERETQSNYKSVAKITKKYNFTNYRHPILLSESTPINDVPSALGTIRIEAYGCIKEPYTLLLSGGGLIYQIFQDGFTGVMNWTINVKYQLTTLKTLSAGIIYAPDTINGCKLWLDACNEPSMSWQSTEGNAQAITQWSDISQENNHLLQNNTTYQPKWYHNFWQRPYLEFDGQTAILFTTDADLLALGTTSQTTWVACFKSAINTTETTGQVVVGINASAGSARAGICINSSSGGGAGAVSFYNRSTFSTSMYACNVTPSTQNVPTIVIGRRDGANLDIIDHEGNTDTSTGGSDVTGGLYFTTGGRFTGTVDFGEFNGEIYEIFCYNVKITDDQRNQVMAYLKNKWDIQ